MEGFLGGLADKALCSPFCFESLVLFAERVHPVIYSLSGE